ncbi:MAG: O-methyltransferase [Candidatus Methanofastidiosia archaeon]|jgi:predicted O-methyltransferase YrrM
MEPADEILLEIQEIAYKNHCPIIGPVGGKILAQIVKTHMPTRILEVGTLLGYSTIVMGKVLSSNAEIVTIEIDEEEARQAREYIQKAAITPKVTVITGDALTVIPTLNRVFDMVFLDAKKEDTYKYLQLIEENLTPGGIVVADDVGWASDAMSDYLKYVRDSGKYQSTFIEENDGIEVSKKL